MPNPFVTSYLLAALAVPLTLHFHLLPAALAGLAVHVLTVKLAGRLPRTWNRVARELALAVIVIGVMLGLCGAIFGLWSFLHGNGGMDALLATVAETMEKLKRSLPPALANALPATLEDLRGQLAVVLHEHGQHISAAGIEGFKAFAHLLLGMVVGGMTALHHFREVDHWRPLPAALYARARALTTAFDKVVSAQLKIAALNTLLTALYLLVVLPLCGVRMPMLTVLVPLTFVAGLLPVVGNLISNAAIVLISLGMSPGVGLASLAFLVAIHKLEYFTNARIVGGEVHARAWELLCAMLVMEAVFGMGGLVAAPVAYAWLKAEFRAREII